MPDWRRRCRYAACFLSELWLHRFPRYLLELLAPFDHVFLAVRHPVADLARLLGRPCSYLPLGADVLRFAPYPHAPERAINVCNIGRRSAVTHAALLQLAADRRFFYYYDTVAASGVDLRQRTFRVQDPARAPSAAREPAAAQPLLLRAPRLRQRPGRHPGARRDLLARL